MSKTIIATVGFIAAAGLAVAVVMQQQTIKESRQEIETLKQQIASLQEQAASAAQDAANASGAVSAQEAQVRDLARLRAEVSALRKQTNELAKARQEIQTLNQRVEADVEEKKGAIAAVQAQAQAEAQTQAKKAQSEMMGCINNLRLIDAAKQQWALENRKTAADTPLWDDVKPYLGHGQNGEVPACPSGGTYTIGAVGEKPTCSIPGHALP